MTDKQWNQLLSVIRGETQSDTPVGFIIDCPWLPGWYGTTLVNYFTSDEIWLRSNIDVAEKFPDIMFLPGFWSEYGMCTEPSAFGAKCRFPENEFPFAGKVIRDISDIDLLEKPDPLTDGLLPFMLGRLKNQQSSIEQAGHQIRFSVSRGPLNVASFLMGVTELMIGLLTEPDKILHLMRIITDFLKEWHQIQRKTFPSIDGILMLDDIVGFISEEDFLTFGYPFIKEIYDDAPVNVKFFHNDADFRASMSHYPDMGVNLFNPGVQTSVNEIKTATNNRLTVLGNIPPRDVLAAGTPEDVSKAVRELLDSLDDRSHFILSCGGGMPPNVSTENIKALIDSAKW